MYEASEAKCPRSNPRQSTVIKKMMDRSQTEVTQITHRKPRPITPKSTKIKFYLMKNELYSQMKEIRLKKAFQKEF